MLEGTDWANLRFVTPLDIALRMGAPFLVERGIDPSEEGLGPALMMRLLLDLPEEGGYFRPLADQPTMAQALWTTVRELRMAGVRARPDCSRTRSRRRPSTQSFARCWRRTRPSSPPRSAGTAGHLVTLAELVLARLPIPRRLGQLEGLKRDRIADYARLAMLDHCHATNPRPCSQTDMEDLLERAW